MGREVSENLGEGSAPPPTGGKLMAWSSTSSRLAGKVGLYALLGAFFFIPLNGLGSLGGLPIGDLFLLSAALAAVAVCLLGWRLPPIPAWLALGAILLALGFLASETLSGVEPGDLDFLNFDPRTSASGYFIRLLVAAFVLPIVAAILAPEWPSIRLLVIAWIAGVTLSCLMAWIDATFGSRLQVYLAAEPESVQWNSFMAAVPRSVGLTNHPNTLALTAVLVFPMVTAFIRDQKSFLHLLPILCLLIVAVLLSGSRAGLLGLIVAVAGSVILVRPFRTAVFAGGLREAVTRGATLVLILVVLIGGILVDGRTSFATLGPPLGTGVSKIKRLIPNGSSLSTQHALVGGYSLSASLSVFERLSPSNESVADSNTTRRAYLSNSTYLIEKRGLTGAGFELIEYSHIVYLQLLIAGGALAFLGFLTLLAGFLRQGIRLRRADSPVYTPIAAGLLASLTAYLAVSFVGNQITDRYIFFSMALILAGSVAARQAQPRTFRGFSGIARLRRDLRGR